MDGVLIGIFVLLFVALVLGAFTVVYFLDLQENQRIREHQERMKALENGVPLESLNQPKKVHTLFFKGSDLFQKN